MFEHRRRRVKRVPGSVVKIPLDDNNVAFGLVLKEPLVAVFDRQFCIKEQPHSLALLNTPVAFIVMVMNYAITDGRWPVIDHVPIPEQLATAPRFCKQDIISGKLSIYQEIEELAPHYERPATLMECVGLEKAAVWDPEHVEDRLRDHFAGRSNVWVEQLRIKPHLVPPATGKT